MKHTYHQLIDKNAVVRAIEEFKKLGREVFLRKYKFWKAKSYYILYQGEHYDSKVIVGAACGFQFGKPLTSTPYMSFPNILILVDTRTTGKGDAGYFSTGVGQSGTSGIQIKGLWI